MIDGRNSPPSHPQIGLAEKNPNQAPHPQSRFHFAAASLVGKTKRPHRNTNVAHLFSDVKLFVHFFPASKLYGCLAYVRK
jgi:hypothetical protein